jgi:hypothetical protein
MFDIGFGLRFPLGVRKENQKLPCTLDQLGSLLNRYR